MMKNIMVLTDFSAAAARAAESALPVAEKLGADIYLVHVYPITPYLPPIGLIGWPQPGPGVKRRERTTKLNRETRRLGKRLFRLNLTGQSPAIRPVTLEGTLAGCVPGLARRKKSKLIVMGVSGRSYGDLLFDGEVKAVLQQATCPVLVIPAGWPGPEIRHILFATDLAAADEAVIAALVNLANRLKARLSLSHVSRPVLIPDFAEEVRRAAFLEKIESIDPHVSSHVVRYANVMNGLVKDSAGKHADVIALRYQKHPLWYHLFHDNPLKEAIEHGHTPLLIFPETALSHD